ncbi:type II secretion system F family protein [Acidipropionibacterium jensenii]|uniref:type II secretion system F family protein n=1 Tax=Acidipropionibacterium jensenii TaxID=1749 RepID=UPI000BC2FD51|nr:pilus assembly protein TadB [Acidipropionibacterium jensenii]
MTGPWLAAALAFAGVWLFLGPRRRVIVTDQRAAGRGPGRYLVGGLLLAVVGVVLVWGRAGVIWAASVAMIAATVWKLAHDQLDRSRRQRRSRQVTEAARALAGRLSIGEVPSLALASIADELEVLAPARRAQEVGADVPEALLRAARTPGQESLTGLARAWRMADLTGAPLAGATTAVAEAMRRRTRLEATLDSELAGPRASGRLMGLLPLAGLGMAQMVGAEPVAFLTSSSAGPICVLAAVALSCGGVLWSEALANRVHREMLP